VTRRTAVHVEVPNEALPAHLSKTGGKVDSCGGLPYPPFLISHGNNTPVARFFCLLHSRFSPFFGLPFGP
jgi:hypothetical protein